MRVVSFNVENLPRLLGSAGLPAVHAAFGAPDVLCLQEVRIRASDTIAIAMMANALPGFDCHYALADDPKNVRFRGGRANGVATFVDQRLGAVALPRPVWEREGRLAMSKVGGLALFNVYAVNGTDRPYWDHDVGAIAGDRHAFKRRFQAHVIEEARSAGSPLVMIGDWNVSRALLDTFPRLRTEGPHALSRAHLNEVLIPELDVVDVFRELHPEARKYTWFNPFARKRLDAARVDYALVSRALLECVVSADIDERPEMRFGSDHAPLSVELDLSRSDRGR